VIEADDKPDCQKQKKGCAMKGFSFERLLIVGLMVGLGTELFGWSLQQAPLMTPWAEQVNPAAPLPEYPRPQMVRSDWLT